MSSKTGYFEDLMSLDTSGYCNLLLFINDKDRFVVEFRNLNKNVVECYVNVLLICYKTPDIIKQEELPLVFCQIFKIYIEKRHIIDSDKDLKKLFFACLAISIFCTEGSCELIPFFQNYDNEDYPGNYDLIKLFVIIRKEDRDLEEFISKNLNVDKLIEKIYSTESILRAKSLDILIALTVDNKSIIQRTMSTILCEDKPDEQKLAVLFNLIKSLPPNDIFFSSELKSSKRFQRLITTVLLSENLQKQALSVVKEIFIGRNTVKPELKLWENFIALILTLKELQSHLVLPSFHLLNDIKQLGPNWYNLVYKLILRHENSLVVSKGIVNWLNQNHFDHDDLDLQICLLNKLNNTALYEKIKIEDLYKYYSSNSGINFLADNLKAINWASVPLAIFIQLFLKSDDVDLIDYCFPVVNSIKNIAIRKLIAYKIICAKIPKLELSRNMTEDFLKILKLLQICEKRLKDLNIYAWLKVFVKEFYEPDASLINEMHLPDDYVIAFMQDLLIFENHPTRFIGLFNQRKLRYLLQIAVIQKYPDILFSFNIEEELQICMKPFISTNYYTTDELIEYCDVLKILEKLANMENIKLTNLYQFNEANYKIEGYSDLNDLYKRLVMLNFNNSGKFLDSFNLEEFLSTNGNIASTDKKLFRNCLLQFLDIYRNMFVKNCCCSKINDLISFIDVGDLTILESVLGVIKEYPLASHPDQFDHIKVLIDRIYQEILVYRRSEHFMKLTKSFIQILTTKIGVPRWKEEILIKYLEILLEQAQNINGLANTFFEFLLVQQIEQLLEWPDFLPILVQGLLFGNLTSKEQRIEEKMCHEWSNVDMDVSDLISRDCQVRSLCVTFLYKVEETIKSSEKKYFYSDLERILINKFFEITKAKERYYADSLVHRHKLRIIQIICVIFKLSRFIPTDLLDILMKETNQHNINYLLEMLAAESCIGDQFLLETLKNPDDLLKTSGIQSLFMVLWYQYKRGHNKLDELVEHLLPWTMAQHFVTRLYAQITIYNIYRDSSQRSSTNEMIKNAIEFYVRKGNTEKHLERVISDFRFTRITDFSSLLTVSNIFINIPKITDMAEDEIMTEKMFEKFGKLLGLKKFNIGQSMDTCKIDEDYKDGRFKIDETNKNSVFNVGSDKIQKKIIPLKHVNPSEDMLRSLPKELCLKKQDAKGDLIVIASLVSRAPNLGGLARTCEIFSASQYVINSLRDVENKEFQALSMSAEKWLNLAELKSYQIVEYIEKMKLKGYSIVGLEQTTGSKPIHAIEFPKKSVLILGHEKEGLPVDIISHLDLVAEIPQEGVIRSLNVHVSGAIFMWEYAKQHIFK